MKTLCLAGLLCFGAAALAQEVQFDYDRSANFSSYRTYQWVDSKIGRAPNQLMDQNINRAVDGHRRGFRRRLVLRARRIGRDEPG